MSSHKSTQKRPSALLLPVEPKRERGRQRVAAVLEAASRLFVQRGFDATTMTEIAAESSTAIGSLYRFFPTRESIADALLAQYVDALTESLREIEALAPTLSLGQLSDALVDMILDRVGQRAVAFALAEARRDGPYSREAIRGQVRAQLVAVISATRPAIEMTRAQTVAAMVQLMLKSVVPVAQEEQASGLALTRELRLAIQSYLVCALS